MASVDLKDQFLERVIRGQSLHHPSEAIERDSSSRSRYSAACTELCFESAVPDEVTQSLACLCALVSHFSQCTAHQASSYNELRCNHKCIHCCVYLADRDWEQWPRTFIQLSDHHRYHAKYDML
jgi:hypothetical protein